VTVAPVAAGRPARRMLQHEQEVAVAKAGTLQVLIEDQQWDRLAALAAERGVSVGSVVRDAIDQAVPGGSDVRRATARAVLAAEPMPVPDPADLRAELRGERAEKLGDGR
jgi:hypothetical protein